MKLLKLLVVSGFLFATGSALAASGGPDSYGYSWIDSDEAGGPTYDWVDIAGVGTPMYLGYSDDVYAGPFPIGFSFPFYGNDFTQIYSCTNGWLNFTPYSPGYCLHYNAPLPSAAAPANVLAAWWYDLVFIPNGVSEAYYYNDGSRFIVQYLLSPWGQYANTYRFQVILYPDGRIVYQYHTLNGALNESTIGIQNASLDVGLTVNHHNGLYPKEGLAILFYQDNGGDDEIAVDIDIKFCSDPNAFNCTKKGVLPVTIFGTDAFDVTDIDIGTLQLCTEDLSACTEAPLDYSIAFRGDPDSDLGAAQCAFVEDVEQDYLTPDDFLDLDVAFDTSEVQDMLETFCDGDKNTASEALIIIGSTIGGTPIYSVPIGAVGTDQLWKVNK